MAMDLSQVNGVVRAEDAGSMPRPVHGYGSVVAFEGSADLISTQLRLLPISSKILILNSLLDAIPRFAAGSRFDAPSFVAHVHKVFAARVATARSFLEDSTEEHPRLVLMNGGSMSAKAACLEKICEKVTSGDLARAEEVYEDIVRSCGLDNMVPAFISAYPELILSRQTSPMSPDFPSQHTTAKSDEEYTEAARKFIQNSESAQERQENIKPEAMYQKDPGFVAMRAASLLDRTAASMHSRQNSDYRFGRTDTLTTRTSIETSVWGLSRAGTVRTVSDGPSDMSLMSRGRTLVRGTLRDRRMGRKRFSSLDSNLLFVDLGHNEVEAPQKAPSPALSLRHGDTTPLSPKSPQRWTRYSEATTVSSLKELNSLLRSSSNRDPKSIPPTPIIFEFGEARMVSYSSPKALKRTSSVDGIFTIPESSMPTKLARRSVLKHSYSTMCLQDEPATFARLSRPPPPISALPAIPVTNQPRQVTVKASKRSLDKLIDAPLLEPDNKKAGMVDRGCSPMRFDPASIENRRTSSIPSMPTSPTVEDLIIHVDDGHRNKILEAIMNGYRNGTNQLTAQSYSKLDSDAPSCTVFNKSTSVARPPNPIISKSTITTDCRYSENKPRPTFANHEIQQPRKGSAQTQISEKDYSRITANATPPTPASTPPPVPQTPTTTQQVRKLSDFGIIPLAPSALPQNNENVTQLAMLENFGIVPSSSIETQNSLRSTLAKHFPSKNGYNQYPIKNDFPDKLWKPVFQDSESTLVGSIARRTMDQILALGCDDFVERGVWTNVLARVESLGMLKDGSAVGRLDMQYLMTTAMETFTTLPLSHQASHGSNPFTSPTQLTKLFVPHLERYLSSNPSVRFLIITFPSASLSSMIALRNLLGQEAMKVAMLSNPRSSTPTLQSVGSDKAINKLSNEATIALNSRKRVPLSRLGNSKAQALLGNDQVPKPIGLKKSANGLMQLSRSSLDSEDAAERADFALEITSAQDSEAVERATDDLIHKIRQVLIEKNSIYGSAVPPSAHFAIANWSAATAPGGRHSPTSSTSSRRSRSLAKKLAKSSVDDGVLPISPVTFGWARGHEVLNNNGLSRSDSRVQRSSPPQLEPRSDSRAERESGEWQKMYLSMGEDLEDFSLARTETGQSTAQSADRPSPSPQPRTKTPEAFNERSDSRATNTSHLESDSEEYESEDDEQLFLPRQGQGNRGMRGGLPVRRDIGKALRMLGIA